MSQIWLHSDWHWRHEGIYKFVDATGVRIRSKFVDMAEGDAYIEQRIRELVKPEDHIYFLGDLCMARENHMAEDFVKLFRSLPGHKRLILGNHDHLKTKWYIDAGFQKIRASNLIDGLLLTHYPVHPSSITFKVKGNAHGHTHQQPDIDHRYLNVSVERTDFSPVPIEWALERFKEKACLATPSAVVDAQGTLITGP